MGVFDAFRPDGRYRGWPIKLHWAGWETDTLRLQTAGWDVYAEQMPHLDAMRIAIHHPRWDTRGLTPDLSFDYRAALQNRDHARQLPPYPISLANRMWIREKHGVERASVFQLIDANPSVDMWAETPIDDFCHFKPRQVDELCVPEASVPELLERIVAMQAGARLERFREQVAEERASKRLIVPHCQIVSLREAA